jgi:hypothetical protein
MAIKESFAAIVLVFIPVLGLAQSTRSAIPDDIQAAVDKVDANLQQFKEKQFVAYDPNYISERKERIDQLKILGGEVFAREAAGQDIQLAHRILIETYWYLTCTADFKRIDQRLSDLKEYLDSTAGTPVAGPADSGEIVRPPYSTIWYCQLEAAYNQMKLDKSFQFPNELLDRINSPEKLTAYFKSVCVSDIAHDGIDQEEQQNEPLADLIRLILRDDARGYSFDPKLKATIVDLTLHQLRDPVTGFWGERYIVDGKPLFVPDLSTTFHVVSFVRGEDIEISDMDKVIATTLAVKDRNTPVGWTFFGRQYNHNCVDVITLFQWGWPHASAEQKKAMAREIPAMIHRCLTESLQPDGSFKHLPIDSSIEEAEHFGADFLARAGYFDPAERFWSDSASGRPDPDNPDFARAPQVRQSIIRFIIKHLSSGATGGVYYTSTLKEDLKYDPAKDN